MTLPFTFTLLGPPVPKQRARKGRGGKWYTPYKTRLYEKSIRACADFHMHTRCAGLTSPWPMGGSYRVRVAIYFPDARRRDADNAAKSVLDAMNGVVYPDDNLVTELIVSKHIDRDRPRTEVTVEAIERVV